MKLRLATPSVLVDIGRLADLSYVRDEGDEVRDRRAHPALRPRALRRARREQAPLLAHVAGQVGDPQVRHRGTIGGSIAHGDPASDLPAALLALRATLVAHGPGGDARDRAPTTSSPASSRPRWRPTRCSPRSGCRRRTAPAGRSRSSTGGPRTGPSSGSPPCCNGIGRHRAGEHGLDAGAGRRQPRRRWPAARQPPTPPPAPTRALDPPADLNASADYRRHLARVLTRRALEAAGA